MTPDQKLAEQTSQLATLAARFEVINRRLRALEVAAAVPPSSVVYAAAFSGTTDGTTSALVVTHSLSLPTPYAVTIQPMSPNGSSTGDRWVSWNVTIVNTNSFTIGRCIAQDGSLLLSTAVSGRFVAVPY